LVVFNGKVKPLTTATPPAPDAQEALVVEPESAGAVSRAFSAAFILSASAWPAAPSYSFKNIIVASLTVVLALIFSYVDL